ncbi:MAG: YIP1 family protein [Candidatus Azobacteroides sp.]|nr:YIP1 family protein [Candidatus Azobacteroides sp.]
MDVAKRVKNMLLTPKTEWNVIEKEDDSHIKLLTTYLIWLAMIPAVAAFIGYGIIGFNMLGIHFDGFELGIKYALKYFLLMIGGAYLTAVAFNFFAANFEGKKSFNRAFQLAAYCYTPVCLGGIFYIYYSITFLAGLLSLYALYLLYLGAKPVMRIPHTKAMTYFAVSLLAMVLIYLVLSSLLESVIGIGSVAQLMR